MRTAIKELTLLKGAGYPSWTLGADLAYDYVGGRYWQGRALSSQAVALTSFSRAGSAWRTASDGKTITAFSTDAARIDSRGLYLEGYDRKRLSIQPVALDNWLLEGAGATKAPLSADGSFTPERIGSGGLNSDDVATQVVDRFSLTNGDTLSLRALYKAGTSGRMRTKVRSTAAGLQSSANGLVGAISAISTSIGNWSPIVNLDYSGIWGFTGSVTVNTTRADYLVGIGPDSAVAAQYVDAYGLQATLEARAGEWIIGTPTAQITQPKDVMPVSFANGKTVGLTFELRSYPGGATSVELLHYGNATDFVRFVHTPSDGHLYAQAYTGGVKVADLDLGAIVLRTTYGVAFTWADDAFYASMDGATSVADTSGTAPTGMTTIYLGSDGSASGAAVLVSALYASTHIIAPASLS